MRQRQLGGGKAASSRGNLHHARRARCSRHECGARRSERGSPGLQFADRRLCLPKTPSALIWPPDPFESPSEIVDNRPGNFKHSSKDGGGEQHVSEHLRR